MNVTQSKNLQGAHWRRACTTSLGAIIFALPGVSASQTETTFLIHSGEPEGRTHFHLYSYVTFDGIISLVGFPFYERAVTEYPEDMAPVPTNPAQVGLTLEMDYMSTGGDERPHVIDLPLAETMPYREVLPKGYYRNTRWRFWWTEGGLSKGQGINSDGKLIVPNVHKVPIYMYEDWVNEPFSGIGSLLANTINLRTNTMGLEEPVSRLATNMDDDYDDNYGCSGWFQFRFYGFIGGFNEGITRSGDLNSLPAGITVVPQITYCGGPNPDGVTGCATLDGTKIAVEAGVLTDPNVNGEIVILHEIGHTKGLEHDDSDSGNLMNTHTSVSTVGIRKDQCPNFSVAKQYVRPDPWEDLR